MSSYFLSAIFYIFYAMFMYLIGTSVCKEERSDSFRLIIGYIIYTAIFSSVTIPIQMFNYSWNLYRLWMFISIGICVAIILFQLYRRKKIVIFPQGFKKLALDNIIFIGLVGALIAVSYCDIGVMMSNNYQDDGYYLVKIATLPYMEKPFWVNPATGIVRRTFNFDTYLLNTWDTEAAFYSNLLHIEPVVFAKFGLAGFNYYLFINSINAVFEKCFKKRLSRYVPLVILFFTCYGLNRIRPMILCSYKLDFSLLGLNLLHTLDGWQFTNAMNFGNIFVRTSGIFFCLLPFVMDDEFKFKHLVLFGVSSIVLMTKSACALPIIIMIFVFGLSAKCFTNKKTIWISVVITLITIGMSFILKGNEEVRSQTSEVLYSNLTEGYLKIYLIFNTIMCIFFLWRKEKSLFIINSSILLFTLFICIEPFSNVVDTLSIYTFVESRALEGALYSLIILCFGNVLYFFNFIPGKKVLNSSLIIVSVCFIGFYLSSQSAELEESRNFLEKNENGIVSSTAELSYALNDLSNETNHQLNVLSFRRFQTEDDCMHFNSYIMRLYAPKIHNITSIYRFGNSTGNAFSTLETWNEDFINITFFLENGNYKKQFFDFLEEFPVNCLVSKWDISQEISKHGFNLYRTIDASDYGFTYYIYFNPDIVDDKEYAPDYGNNDSNWCFELEPTEEFIEYTESESKPTFEEYFQEKIQNDTDYSQFDGGGDTDELNIDESDSNDLDTDVIIPDNPGTEGTESGTGENNPGSGENNPGSGETNPGSGETNPGSGETIPGSGETNPGTGETNPGTGGTGSDVVSNGDTGGSMTIQR